MKRLILYFILNVSFQIHNPLPDEKGQFVYQTLKVAFEDLGGIHIQSASVEHQCLPNS